MTRPLVVFRCDAGPEIGGGHVVRCMGLADAFEQDGWAIGFAVSTATSGAVPALARRSWPVVAGFDGGVDAVQRLRAHWPQGADLTVIDHYGIGAAEEGALDAWTRARLAIDDLADRNHECEFLCDQGIGRTPAHYENLVPPECKVLAGAQFAVLRPEFAEARHRLKPAERGGGVRRLVVSCGMLDTNDVTSVVLDGVEAAQFAGRVDVILGAAAPNLERLADRLQRWPEDAPAKVRLHTELDARELADLLGEADLAIGAAGTSSHERCCLGVPALIVALADNQNDNIRALETAGAARSLGWWEALTGEAVSAALLDLVQSPQALLPMREAALRQADGRGAQRLVSSIRPELGSDGTPITLRPVAGDDVALIFQWQLHPETRRFARNPSAPSWDEHQAWFAGKLSEPAVLFNVIMAADDPVGVLRLDPVASSSTLALCYEVSLLIAPEFHRRGIGNAALKLGRRLVPEAEIQAVVLPQNVVSQRLFERAGYRASGDRLRQMPEGMR